MKQPPIPNVARNKQGLNRLTKSLLEQHEAFQEIDENDETQRLQFIAERERKVSCNWCYNWKKIWRHIPQNQERLYKILFVKFNNFDNSLYSTSRNATVFNFNAENMELDTYNQSIYYSNDEKNKLFATQQERMQTALSVVGSQYPQERNPVDFQTLPTPQTSNSNIRQQ